MVASFFRRSAVLVLFSATGALATLSVGIADEPPTAPVGPIAAPEASSEAGESSARPTLNGRSLVERDGQMLPTATSIRMFEERVRRAPGDLGSRVTLGRLFLRKAREDDDFEAFERAEALFREVLESDATSDSARLFLSEALQAQHRFAEAVEVADVVRQKSPNNAKVLAVCGDALLELGRYDEAAKAYEALAAQGKSPAVLARLAHLHELHGRTDEAVAAVTEAVRQEVEQGRPPASVAWYRWRLGSILAKAGQREEAAAQFEEALKLDATDAASLAGLAGVRAADGHPDEAVELYAKAVKQMPSPPLLAQYGDLLTRLGRTDEAAGQYAEAEAAIEEEAVTSAGKAHYREVSRYFSARGLQSERALKLAELDAQTREDVYAFDTLAWALYRNDRFDEAAAASEKALRLGTRDPLLHFRAGMIADRRGDATAARQALSAALEIDPQFAPLEADEARATLQRLNASASAVAPD